LITRSRVPCLRANARGWLINRNVLGSVGSVGLACPPVAGLGIVSAMASLRRLAGDQDSPWKEALEQFLAPFLALFFPAIHDAIDWSRGYESLDKELQQVVRDARIGRRLADKLFKVLRKNGREAWLLIHIEIQGKSEKAFPERMFVYSYRIYDRYRRSVFSLAVLRDDNPNWRPDRFEYNMWGCSVGIRFLTVKLLDYQPREAVLDDDPTGGVGAAISGGDYPFRGGKKDAVCNEHRTHGH
jgi:hypothetical protein